MRKSTEFQFQAYFPIIWYIFSFKTQIPKRYFGVDWRSLKPLSDWLKRHPAGINLETLLTIQCEFRKFWIRERKQEAVCCIFVSMFDLLDFVSWNHIHLELVEHGSISSKSKLAFFCFCSFWPWFKHCPKFDFRVF